MRLPARLALLLALCGAAASAADSPTPRKPGDYPLPPEALPQAGIPRGTLEGPLLFRSRVIPNTVREYWIFVPAQYAADRPPANLLVFQDGQRATNPNGPLRVQQVLENLVGRGDIPVTIGLFVTPGQVGDAYPGSLGMGNPDHRAEEYDSLSDDYSQMLITELLPEVQRRYSISPDPWKRIIAGTSSGAICAFTVAWRHPEQFRNVLSMIGSFTAIAYRPPAEGRPMVPGGDLYPTLIRKNPIRPLKVFLQDGSNDLSNEHGNWFLANQQMLSALEWANANADATGDKGGRYRINHAWGDGGHSDTHGGSILPDMIRWTWPRRAVD
jgi:hypothetical protein